jgi:TPR repeat protein
MDDPRDLGKAKQLFGSLCEKNVGGACTNLGAIHEDRGDLKEAVVSYEKACEMGDAAACGNVAFMYRRGKGVSQDKEKAFSLNAKACEKREPRGCNNLGDMYETGDGVKKDIAKAQGLYEQVCAKPWDATATACCGQHSATDAVQRHAFGCYSLALLLQRESRGNSAKIAALFKQACEAGVEKACNR